MMAKSWQQEPEAAGPLTSTVREQREMLGGVRTALSFNSLQDCNPWGGADHIQVGSCLLS